MSISVIIPVLNEETYLENCLKSVSFADEIVVLDSGSTDSSKKIAKAFGARVHEYSWQGFRYAHELGAKLAKSEWLLYVDADERVSLELATSILTVVSSDTNVCAFQVKRKNYIMGKFLAHGGWYPDTMTRLIKKSALKKWIGELHEYPEIEGSTGILDGDLYHLTHRGVEWSLEKTQSYTKKTAQIYFESNHPPVKVKNFFGAMVREFWYRAVKKSGWKDGIEGWYEIVYQTFNAFLVQVQLWELQQRQTMNQKYQDIDAMIRSELDSHE